MRTKPEQIAQRIIDKEQRAKQQTKGIIDKYLNYGGKHKTMKR